MSVDIVANNPSPYLNQINRKRNSSNDFFESIAEHFNIGPAYIVEISAEGRQLQQAHQIRIVRLIRKSLF